MANIHLGKVIVNDEEWDFKETEIYNVSNLTSEGTILYLHPDYDTFGQNWNSPIQPNNDIMTKISTSSSGKYAIVSIKSDAIWYSKDNGLTWLQSNSIIGDWSAVAISALGQYASACLDGSGIYYSSNFGKTWLASDAASFNILSDE